MPESPLSILDPPAIRVRVHARARRLSLRVDQRGAVLVIAPPHCGRAEVSRFVARHADWVEQRLAALPPHHPFADGAVIPFRGEPHRVRHDPAARRPVERQAEPALLVVGGRAEHLPRRLHDFLVAEAGAELGRLSREKAVLAGARVASVRMRDTRSRWGSCSATGRLNYCWRLILAPPFVADYVAAHEVAHLREPNHQPAFWALVDRLTPHRAAATEWLRRQGAGLHRFG